ncbi:MAG TPA: hypothetical protein VMT21_10975 [Gemmatimonadales bacterium]|nr:hypothetical protein [Gemmatimonadales bacterium]
MTIGTQYLTHGERVEPRSVLGWATLVAGALVALFWAVYFSDAAALGQQDPLKAGFEAAFPLADLVFAGMLIATGVLFLMRRESAVFFLIAAASMSLYLGLLDVTFYARHGLYALTPDSLTEMAINALCVGGGVFGLRAAWQIRRVP